MKIPKWLSISLVSCLCLCSAACGRDRQLVRTEVAEVETAAWVQLDPELTADVPEPPPPETRKNESISDWIDAMRWGYGQLRTKLCEIRQLQPDAPREKCDTFTHR